MDIGQLKRLVAHHRRLSPKRERRVSGNAFLNFQVSPDETTTNIWGELPGLDARMVEKAVDQRADEIIGSEAKPSVAERRAVALVAICQDSLYDGDTAGESSPTEVVGVTLDARVAAPTNGQAGVSVLAGPRLGPGALAEILCNGIVEVIGITRRRGAAQNWAAAAAR